VIKKSRKTLASKVARGRKLGRGRRVGWGFKKGRGGRTIGPVHREREEGSKSLGTTQTKKKPTKPHKQKNYQRREKKRQISEIKKKKEI